MFKMSISPFWIWSQSDTHHSIITKKYYSDREIWPNLTALTSLHIGCSTCMHAHNTLSYWLRARCWDNTSDLKHNFMCISASRVMGEMDNSVTSGKATVKRDLVLAPGRQGEAVCPLNALLQSQQPCANSLSPVCRRLCSVAWLLVRLPDSRHTP